MRIHTAGLAAGRILCIAVAVGCIALAAPGAYAASAAELDRDSASALRSLVKSNPGARALAKEAHAVLVFPRTVKGGFLFGGQFGDGAMREGGRVVGYYRSIAASYGLQAGIQSFGYALFFMNE